METLLVIDDDEVLLRSFARAARGWRVITAGTIATALRAAHAEDPSAVVVDLCLREENGIELVRSLRKHDPTLPIVVMTGQRSAEAGFEAARGGADLVVEKPVTLATLLGNVQTIRACPRPLTLLAHRDAYVAAVLEATDGNRSEAARRLGIHRYSLQRMLAKHPVPGSLRPARKGR